METNAVVETDSVPDAPAEPGPIFVETADAGPAAPPTPAAAPEPDVKAERLAHVRELAAQSKALKAEREALAWQRQQEQNERAAMRAELQALQQDPWGYVKTRHGLDARQVAEAELLAGSDESAATRAERLAMQTQAKLDAIVADARSRQEAAQRVDTFEKAKAQAVAEFEKGASTKWEALDAFITKTAEKTGQSKQEVLVSELLDTVERVRRDPRFGPHLAEYQNADFYSFMNERFAVVAPPKPAKEKTYKTRSDDNSTMTKITPGAPLGSNSHRRAEAKEIVDAWKAARGDRASEAKPYSAAEIAAVEAQIIGSDGRVNKGADRRHSAMILHNSTLTARGKAA